MTCFLIRGDQVLLLRRSHAVNTYRGKWAGVSGSVDENTAQDQAYREIAEETGLTADDVELVGKSDPIEVTDEELSRQWLIHPFLFRVLGESKIRLDWEHTEYLWIEPDRIQDMETVPKLKETWDQLQSANGSPD